MEITTVEWYGIWTEIIINEQETWLIWCCYKVKHKYCLLWHELSKFLTELLVLRVLIKFQEWFISNPPLPRGAWRSRWTKHWFQLDYSNVNNCICLHNYWYKHSLCLKNNMYMYKIIYILYIFVLTNRTNLASNVVQNHYNINSSTINKIIRWNK